MTADGTERRLAAILIADLVGYSRLMGADEAATLLAMAGHRFALIDPTIGQHQGRIVKTTGDGLLVEFRSAVAAVDCAAAIQRGMVARNAAVPEDRRIRYRIGVNIGDIVIRDGDIFGDAVNVAARLEAAADPDGVCISAAVLAHVEQQTGHVFADGGAHRFRNIDQPVRIFRWSAGGAAPAQPAFRPFVDLPAAEAPHVTGGCMCGNVRYEGKEKPLGSMLCHCRMCQRFSGAPVLGGTTFRTEALRFTRGGPKFYRSSEIAERGFCPDCGTALVYRGVLGRWTQWIMVCTASLDAPENFPPTYHLGVESQMPWLALHDGLPRTKCHDSPSLIEAYAAVGHEVP